MEDKQKTAFIIGNLPPPIGGISVHVHRLAHLLVNSGYKVEVYNFSNCYQGYIKYPFRQLSGNIIQTILLFIWRAIKNKPKIIHLHISSIGRGIFFFPILCFLGSLRKIIITIHGGTFPEDYKKANKFIKFIMKWGFRTFTIVVVNNDIKQLILNECYINRQKILVIPAYLEFGKTFPSYRQTKSNVFIASGYGIKLYFWEGLILALEGLNNIDEVILAFYDRYEHPYYEHVIKKVKSLKGVKVTIYNNLSQEEFQKAIKRSKVFIRPTLNDGDSLAVREALAQNKIVIASDAVKRPEGCILFRNKDILDLRDKILNYEKVSSGYCSPKSFDFSQSILELYARLS